MVILVVVGALLIVVVAAWGLLGRSSHAGGWTLRDGPLATDGQDVEGTPVRVGDTFAYAGLTLFNTGSRPLVLESVEVDPPPRGLRQVASYVVAPGRTLNAVEFTARSFGVRIRLHCVSS